MIAGQKTAPSIKFSQSLVNGNNNSDNKVTLDNLKRNSEARLLV